jgi:formylglycine-generating enzyme required for sulfatase activity
LAAAEFAIAGWSPVAAQPPGTTPRARDSGSGRWALLIGVDDYTWAKKLEYCGADMRALAEHLAGSGFPKDHVYLLDDKATEGKYRPTKVNIDAHLKLVLGLVDRNDLIVVGFSGHGVHLQGKSYLCPGDAKLDDPRSLVSLDRVYELLQQSPATLKLLLVDACRNDPRLDGQRSFVPTEGTRQFASALERPPQGILLLTSCAPGEVAREDRDLGHGVFMHYLLEGLEGKADSSSNGRVSLMELYVYANSRTKTHVARKFADSQRPALKGDIHDDFDLTEMACLPKEITNSIGMKLVLIPAGAFPMGTSAAQVDRLLQTFPDLKAEQLQDEMPQRQVRISRPFYLGAYEVTAGQFGKFVVAADYKTEAETDRQGGFGWNEEAGTFDGPDPKYAWRSVGWPQSDGHPVVNVTWNDARRFCDWLAKGEGRTYRLPTEAEWEYACRAGSATTFPSGENPEGLATIGNTGDAAYASRQTDAKGWVIKANDGYIFTAPVGSYKPNAFGLCDMTGNVWEWCSDWYGKSYYATSPTADPTGPTAGSFRVIRGGGFNFPAAYCRSADRHGNTPTGSNYGIGFRVVLEP